MAWKESRGKSHANRAALLTELWSFLSNAGWTLHDNQDGSSYRIYSSTGEAADRIAQYVKIDFATANKIYLQAYYDWNATSHTGTGATSAAGTTVGIDTAETGQNTWIYGDKNLVFVINKISTSWYHFYFGHLPKKFHAAPETALTSGISSGSNVTLTVSSTAGFIAGQSYQIVGAAAEGRDDVTINSITNSTQMVASSIARSYGTGTKVGVTPSVFVMGKMIGTNTTYTTCPRGATGTSSAASAYYSMADLLTTGLADPDSYSGERIIWPMMWQNASSGSAYVGWTEEGMFGATTSLTNEDILVVGKLDSGTSSGSNDSTHLNDTGKSWTADAYNNKVVVITGGTGQGQVRKIADTTTTQLTVAEAWDTTPDGTSTYQICEEAYRYFFSASVVQLFVREGK